MTSLPGFTVDIDQNPYLPSGGRDVSAIVTVTADDKGDAPAAQAAAGGSAEIVIIDCSGSMDYPPTKMSQAKVATAAAIDVVRDGVGFAVEAGGADNITAVLTPFPPVWSESLSRRQR